MRGDFNIFDAFHPEWMEYTTILGTIALWIGAVALIALVVKSFLDGREQRTSGESDTAAGPTATETTLPATPAPAPSPAVPTPAPSPAGAPRDVLDRRYAAGAIDREEYLARRKDLD
jgi:putative oligomerization/nucleic acid binding protein